jgi:hypothetical protein
MNQRDDHSQFRNEGERNSPEQYGQEHYSHEQHGREQHEQRGDFGQQGQYGQSGQHGQYGQYGQDRFGAQRWRNQQGQFDQPRYAQTPYGQPRYGDDQYGRDPYGQGSGQRSYGGQSWGPGQNRDSQHWGSGQNWGPQGSQQRWSRPDVERRPFERQHSYESLPFAHSPFDETNQPRYFGTGTQGYGGGPSFTGGAYSDERAPSPYFQEAGFNRGYYDDSPSQYSERDRFGEHWAGRSGRDSWTSRENWSVRPNQYGASQYGTSQHNRRYPAGPKGYARSDERIREDISERLMEAFHIDSSEVTVQVLGGRVTLEGTVPDRRMKHAIEDVADTTSGVQDVDNRVRVVGFSSGAGGSTSTAGVGAAGTGVSGSATSAGGVGGSAASTNGRPGSRRDA